MILNYIFGLFCNKIGCVFEIVIDRQILWIVVMQIVSNVILKKSKISKGLRYLLLKIL